MGIKEILIICAVVLALIIILLIVFRKKQVYEMRESPMSDAENYFFYLVKDMLPERYSIIPQPSLANCFSIKKSERGALNRIISKRFDYIIVRNSQIREFPYHYMELVMAIELDDKSHQRPERRERDKFVESICYQAGLPLLRYECKSNSKPDYDAGHIENEIRSIIKAYEKKR